MRSIAKRFNIFIFLTRLYYRIYDTLHDWFVTHFTDSLSRESARMRGPDEIGTPDKPAWPRPLLDAHAAMCCSPRGSESSQDGVSGNADGPPPGMVQVAPHCHPKGWKCNCVGIYADRPTPVSTPLTGLPVEAVEAAAEVLYNRQLMPDETPWHLTSELDREEPREDAEAALTAAMPAIERGHQAQALEDAADAMDQQAPREGYVVVHPERVGAWLRERASLLRTGETE